MERRVIRETAALVRDHTPAADALIVAPAIVALEASRVDPFHYRELLGVCRWARDSLHQIGWDKTSRIGRYAPFHALEEESRVYWMREMTEAIRERRLAAVVPDADESHFAILFPWVLSPMLTPSGYRRVQKGAALGVWVAPNAR